MSDLNRIEGKFIKEINADDFKVNTDAIAFALNELNNAYSETDYEDLMKNYLDNPRLEYVLEILNPFEEEGFENLFTQANREEAFETFIEFASIDGLNEPAKEILVRLNEGDFFDLSYALAVNDKKDLFENMSVDYIKKIPVNDLKAIISCIDDNIRDVFDKRTLKPETIVFMDSAKKYTSSVDDMIVSFKNYEFTIKCIENGAKIQEQMRFIEGYDRISQSDMNKIIEKLSGNKKEVSIHQYADVERKIQENIEKKRNSRKFSF
jgi:hypothetical protein